MRVRGGHTIEVYRNVVKKDRFGDPVSDQPEKVGSIEHVVFQWHSGASVGLRFHPSESFQETAALSAVLFAPRNHEIQLQDGDRIKLKGTTYQVVGDRAWDEVHPVTMHDFGYYMMQVEAVT